MSLARHEPHGRRSPLASRARALLRWLAPGGPRWPARAAGRRADLLTLPARKWKWRMRGAAITMAAQAQQLARGMALRRAVRARRPSPAMGPHLRIHVREPCGVLRACRDAVAGVPWIVYFHENQFVYPNRHIAEWDFQFPLTNITLRSRRELCLQLRVHARHLRR